MNRIADKGWSLDSVIPYFRSGCLRAVAFALIWWMLTTGAVGSWLVGVPMVLIATLVSLVLVPTILWSPSGVALFVPFFVWRSLYGGVDVAWRAFHPSLPIAPGLIEYPLRLSPGLPRVFMVNTVSLLPGTLSAELRADCLKVHVLDTRKNVLSELMVVEQAVARMFATSLKNAERGDCNEQI
ncbi:Na+/H+ antiporter subunit E [Neptunomonas qingdaonensis]|uniref:Multicomponent Na+:H+ antiporter subunit E n=1 Tax=Neptunomonas qingdaonensis TaxID=1045558 RepID=A0A1I2LTT7_9GAMM|nr:Na+/H+ antiporter subunit E [Neptunomonas qingdaonensis]SFF81929.1 multicomponent Na+:H+ antiporter subunit E [Neptunomonas qingdaonensis]